MYETTREFYKIVTKYFPDKEKREIFLKSNLGQQYLLRCLSLDVYNLEINTLNKPLRKLEKYISKSLGKN